MGEITENLQSIQQFRDFMGMGNNNNNAELLSGMRGCRGFSADDDWLESEDEWERLPENNVRVTVMNRDGTKEPRYRGAP